MDTLIEPGWADYALIDTGNNRKLERFGKVVVDRPETQALWTKSQPEGKWLAANATFANASEREDDEAGSWNFKSKPPETWPVKVEGVTMVCRFMSFRHMGLFPEQRPHWVWVADQCKRAGRPLKILNLFAYTGAASLIAAKAGAHVTHVDASKKAIQWAKDNQIASNLEQAPIRWICDDAQKFVAREIRRGNTYDGILLDPPRFGRGPEGEVWKFETDVMPFMNSCAQLLSPDARFMILTAYTLRLSCLTLEHMMRDAIGNRKGKLDSGELVLKDESGKRPLPTSLFARWSA